MNLDHHSLNHKKIKEITIKKFEKNYSALKRKIDNITLAV